MPFALVIIGLIMIVTAAKGTHAELGAQLQKDFTGPGNFGTWVVALGAVGALGYVPSLQTFSRLFLVLVLIGLILSNGGFFAKFSDALKTQGI